MHAIDIHHAYFPPVIAAKIEKIQINTLTMILVFLMQGHQINSLLYLEAQLKLPN